MHRNQHHNRGLITVTVRPGSETGLYYILVANLAHSTTWKDLKAFAAQACEVDHAEVYPPTSGFVRVRGRENFEQAFKHLDGNTLEYRALQADARNMNQSTVVKLLPTDYHAARILRGDTGRVFSEPNSPSPGPNGIPAELFTQTARTGIGSFYMDYQGSVSPAFNMAPKRDTPWAYLASPSYISAEGYSPMLEASRSVPPYQVVAVPAHGFSQPVVTRPHLTIQQLAEYQAAATGPVSATTTQATAPYPFAAPVPYHPPAAAYDVGGGGTGAVHSYASYVQPNTNAPVYPDAWSPPPEPALSPPLLPPGQVLAYGGSDGSPVMVVEQRKIIILHLERDGLSEAVVTNLLVEHAGIGSAPGEIEHVEVPINKDGRARGIAFVVFAGAQLAAAAVAALDGREVVHAPGVASRGKKLAARIADGVAQGGVSSRPGQRIAGTTAGEGRSGDPFVGGGGAAGEPSPVGRARTAARGWGASAFDSALTSASASASALAPVGNGGQNKKKEEPPIIVDGSGGRWKKQRAPLVVHGSAGKGR